MDITVSADEMGDIHVEVEGCFSCKGAHRTPLFRLEHPIAAHGTTFIHRLRCPTGGANILVWLPPDPRSSVVCYVPEPINSTLIPHRE